MSIPNRKPSPPTGNPTAPFQEILARMLSRRELLRGAGLGLAGLAAGSLLPGCSAASGPVDRGARSATAGKLGFRPVPVSTADTVVVPPGYSARVLYAWGDPISDGPAFRQDATNPAADQALQAGMHHDGMHFFPLPRGSASADHGLLVLNHEYIAPGLLHPDGGHRHDPFGYDREKLDKELAAHGVSVIEVRRDEAGEWHVVRPSALARRITAATPMALAGPAAGHPLMRTSEDPAGRTVLGTFNNCAHGVTPWGTYLTCEENFHGHFDVPDGHVPDRPERYRRYRLVGAGYLRLGWSSLLPRFDVAREPNEPHRHGWVVEIDPFDPDSTPVKRTALGRFAHESATCVLGPDGTVAVYSGDDERFEYAYKFVASRRYDPTDPASGRGLLDEGTLYVARFHEDGSGDWLPLVHGQGPLTPENGFADQAEVLVFARNAADALGATPMDRPEWIAANPRTRELYLSLTMNELRGAPGQPAADAANPRAANPFGHILRWREDGDHPGAPRFRWDILALAGEPAGDGSGVPRDAFANPDGLWMDDREVLWIQTDIPERNLRAGAFAGFGNNMMLACDPDTGEIRRFLTGPVGCEVTGLSMTPDLRTFFVNIQHPGEVPGDLAALGLRTGPASPTAVSAWPDGPAAGRPRSATVVITRDDGGVIGA
ncbi:MAG: PhoX family phosphatase [Xanthomonadales bacterium]|nr:PhoX family phosphatase [Xanthomonadales bacterium]